MHVVGYASETIIRCSVSVSLEVRWFLNNIFRACYNFTFGSLIV